jgi:hypothetical protein
LIVRDLDRVLTRAGFLTKCWKHQPATRRNPTHGF